MKLRHKVYCAGLFILQLISSNAVYAGQISRSYTDYSDNSSITRIGRYSTVANKPSIEQINPLMAIAQFRFQTDIRTVGDAVRQVLQNTSYSLVPNKALSPIARETLSKNLPITVRTLGPIRIKEALLVLMGKEVFDLVVDPVHRLIDFHLKHDIAKALGANKHDHH